jgi:nucleoid DNA-binding protein
MIDITAHIRELLYKHDCVILPSFGGLIGNYRPAQIDKHTNTFSPPVKAISFNRNLVHNDGLLIGKISEERKIGYADSKRIIEDFISDLKKGIEKGERVAFDRIGYFQANSEGNIEFEPDRDMNFLLDSYGFTSFRREPVISHDLTGRAAFRNMDSVRSSNRKMAWRAVTAVPFIAAMILIPLKTDFLKSRASLNPINGIELADSELKSTRVLSSEREEELSKPLIDTEENIGEQIVTKEPLSSSYYIVAGSFKSRDNALRMVEEAGSKGYNAVLSENDNGFIRVLLNSYSTKEEALKLREKISSDYPDCWVLKK